jgi:hypothetical protein
MKVHSKTFIISSIKNDSIPTDYCGANSSSHKPYIHDTGGSATRAGSNPSQRHNFNSQKYLPYFISSSNSPVGADLSNSKYSAMRSRGLSENYFPKKSLLSNLVLTGKKFND